MINPLTAPGTRVVANRTGQYICEGKVYVVDRMSRERHECFSCSSPFYAVLRGTGGVHASICALDYAALPDSLTKFVKTKPVKDEVRA